MKKLRQPRFVGMLILAAMTASLAVPQAEAGSRSKRSHGDWRSAGRAHDRAWSDHPAHRWFDSREYCGGKDAHGCWLTEARCEDRYGRKWVNNADWVAHHQWRDRDDWRAEERYRRSDHDPYRNR